MKKIWFNLFLVERPSILLAFFRLPVAFAVLAVVVPSFFHLPDTFYPTAFKEYNGHFFPTFVIELVRQSPTWLINFFVILFLVSGLFFLVGFWTQLSAILVMLCSYYFYALNSFAIGTLSWDILLVTLVTMCLTPYPGDFFSVDSLLSKKKNAFKRVRPYFIQRLLQVHIAATFFLTALHKITIEGNWLKANPIFYLMNSPPQGVVKNFILKDVLRDLPEVCFAIGIFIVVVELLLPFFWFYRRTRVAAIYAGFLFHLVLILTLDVPATFFFVFPAQMLLFINPQKIVDWIEKKQRFHVQFQRSKLIYDGSCVFCRGSVKILRVLDVFYNVEYVDGSVLSQEEISRHHPLLTIDQIKREVCLVKPTEELFGGFDAFKGLCWVVPLMTPLAIVFYFPGMGLLGPFIYRLIARYRYLLMGKKSCTGGCHI